MEITWVPIYISAQNWFMCFKGDELSFDIKRRSLIINFDAFKNEYRREPGYQQ